MTLAFFMLEDGRALSLDFGDPPIQKLTLEQRIDAVLSNVDAHRSMLWLLPRLEAEAVLTTRLRQTSATKEQPSDPSIVIPLLQALGRLGAGNAVHLVVPHLSHPALSVQLAAIEAVGRIGTELQEKLITPFLHSGVAELEQAALLALAHFPTERALGLVEAAAIQRPSLAPLAAIYNEQLNIKRAEDPDAYVFAYLKYEHREDLVPMVPYLFESFVKAASKPELVQWVVYLWAAACDRQAAQIMATMVAEPRAPIELRRTSATAMGRIPVRGAASILIEQLASPDPELQRNCVVALGRIGRAKALLPLLSVWPAQGGALHQDIRVAAYRVTESGAAEELVLRFERGEALARLFLLRGEEVVEGYHPLWIRAELGSPLPTARRDALLIFASYCPDDDVLQTLAAIGKSDADVFVRDFAQRLYRIRYAIEARRGTLPHN